MSSSSSSSSDLTNLLALGQIPHNRLDHVQNRFTPLLPSAASIILPMIFGATQSSSSSSRSTNRKQASISSIENLGGRQQLSTPPSAESLVGPQGVDLLNEGDSFETVKVEVERRINGTRKIKRISELFPGTQSNTIALLTDADGSKVADEWPLGTVTVPMKDALDSASNQTIMMMTSFWGFPYSQDSSDFDHQPTNEIFQRIPGQPCCDFNLVPFDRRQALISFDSTPDGTTPHDGATKGSDDDIIRDDSKTAKPSETSEASKTSKESKARIIIVNTGHRIALKRAAVGSVAEQAAAFAEKRIKFVKQINDDDEDEDDNGNDNDATEEDEDDDEEEPETDQDEDETEEDSGATQQQNTNNKKDPHISDGGGGGGDGDDDADKTHDHDTMVERLASDVVASDTARIVTEEAPQNVATSTPSSEDELVKRPEDVKIPPTADGNADGNDDDDDDDEKTLSELAAKQEIIKGSADPSRNSENENSQNKLNKDTVSPETG